MRNVPYQHEVEVHCNAFDQDILLALAERPPDQHGVLKAHLELGKSTISAGVAWHPWCSIIKPDNRLEAAVFDFESDAQKQVLFAAVGSRAREVRAQAVIPAMDAWAVEDTKNPTLAGIPPSEHPDRYEVFSAFYINPTGTVEGTVMCRYDRLGGQIIWSAPQYSSDGGKQHLIPAWGLVQ